MDKTLSLLDSVLSVVEGVAKGSEDSFNKLEKFLLRFNIKINTANNNLLRLDSESCKFAPPFMLDTLGLREKITLVIINNSQTNTNLTHTTNIYGINPETKELPEDFAQSLNTAYELYKELQSESPDVRAYFQMNRIFPNENYFEIVNFRGNNKFEKSKCVLNPKLFSKEYTNLGIQDIKFMFLNYRQLCSTIGR